MRQMKIEDAIKQKTFRSITHKLSVNLFYTYNWIIAKQKDYFKKYDITHQQYNVLRILRGRHPEPYSTSQIRERMIDKMSDVSRIVDRLVKKGLVVSTPCEHDKRLVDVVISKKGLTLLGKMDKTIISLEDLFCKLTNDQQAQMSDFLDAIRDTE